MRSVDKRHRDYRWKDMRVKVLQWITKEDISQTELAKRIDVGQKCVNRWLNFDDPVPPNLGWTNYKN